MNFDPYNCLLKIRKSIGAPTPKMGIHLGVWGFIPSQSFASREHEMWLSSSVLARTFVNPCLGHEPKTRVATPTNSCENDFINEKITFPRDMGIKW
jgi:hypothetical protein